MLAGLEEVSEGDILIGDRVVNDVPPKDRDIAMVFQSYALYPHMSVYDNMAFGLKLRKMPKAEIDRRVKEASRHPGVGQSARPQAQGALRRPAPARCCRPGHCARAGGVSHG
jgi:ABC-type sugar transport system ATPase subunit